MSAKKARFGLPTWSIAPSFLLLGAVAGASISYLISRRRAFEGDARDDSKQWNDKLAEIKSLSKEALGISKTPQDQKVCVFV